MLPILRNLLALTVAGGLLAACDVPPDAGTTSARTAEGKVLPIISTKTANMYRTFDDGDFVVPAISREYLSEDVARQYVEYYAPYAEGTIVVDPHARHLYLISGPNEAMRYAIGVGKAGYGLRGEATIRRKEEWPYWTPTANMLRREPEKYRPVASGLPGGLENPLGARALYLYRGGRDTLFRIHGTPYPWTVGGTDSGGCIRMFNHDAIHLYANVPNGTRVVVLSEAQMGKWTTAPTQLASAE